MRTLKIVWLFNKIKISYNCQFIVKNISQKKDYKSMNFSKCIIMMIKLKIITRNNKIRITFEKC